MFNIDAGILGGIVVVVILVLMIFVDWQSVPKNISATAGLFVAVMYIYTIIMMAISIFKEVNKGVYIVATFILLKAFIDSSITSRFESVDMED